MTSVQIEAGSFRDRHGRVIYHQGEVFRCLSNTAAEQWQRLDSKAFFRTCVGQGKIIATTKSDLDPQTLELPDGDRWDLILQHQRIPFVSYPYEWCFSMLKDAALLQLELLAEALKEGMILKDASAYNIQWIGCNPTFIDITSFEAWEKGSAWVGYRQFCQLFLFPLLIQAYRDIPFQPLLRGALDGITPNIANKLFSARDRLRPGVFTHVFLQSKMTARYGGTKRDVRKELRSAGFNRELIQQNVKGLTKLVKKLDWISTKSEWGDYLDIHNYSDADVKLKMEFVEAAVKNKSYELVWDIGANTGKFSRIAAEHAGYVIAADIDQLAVERNYQKLRRDGHSNVLPLLLNLADPSPNIGWRLRERKELALRGAPDLILCLALIHHIVITANIPLAEFVEWLRELNSALIIEFVSRDDEMVGTLLRNKEDQYHDYDLGYFEKCLEKGFKIETRETLTSGNRILYFATPIKTSPRTEAC